MMDWQWLPAVLLLPAAAGVWWMAGQAGAWLAERSMPEHEPGEMLVKFAEGLAAEGRHRIHRRCGCEAVEELGRTGLHVVRSVRGRASARKLKALYERHPGVEFAEPNYVYRTCLVPGDPYYSLQHGPKQIGAEQAWEKTRGDRRIIIAVLDTGIDSSHPDLADKVLPGKDFVDPAGTGEDGNGHGTHVAGIAAAEADNGIGIAGVAPGVSLLPVRVLDAAGNGTLRRIAAGIRYAADQGAHVINLSLGGPARSSALRAAIRYAVAKGAVVVAAAGNTGSSDPVYPGAYDEVIAVGSVDPQDLPSAFSAYGPWVELAAPGERIASTYAGGRYTYFSGTSMAAPHVAGTAALLASLGLTGEQIRARLLETADRTGDGGLCWSYGRVDAGQAVAGGGEGGTDGAA